jgi:hypothetical protein
MFEVLVLNLARRTISFRFSCDKNNERLFDPNLNYGWLREFLLIFIKKCAILFYKANNNFIEANTVAVKTSCPTSFPMSSTCPATTKS